MMTVRYLYTGRHPAASVTNLTELTYPAGPDPAASPGESPAETALILALNQAICAAQHTALR